MVNKYILLWNTRTQAIALSISVYEVIADHERGWALQDNGQESKFLFERS